MDNTTKIEHKINNDNIIIIKTKIYKNRSVKIVKMMSIINYRKNENTKTYIKTQKNIKKNSIKLTHVKKHMKKNHQKKL